MKVAAQHAEGERVRAREHVEERLLLGGVALQRRDVARGDIQGAIAVKADLANPPPPRSHEAAVTAGEAAHGAALEPFHQLSRARTRVQGLGEARRSAVWGVMRDER